VGSLAVAAEDGGARIRGGVLLGGDRAELDASVPAWACIHTEQLASGVASWLRACVYAFTAQRDGHR
jgi:hypothetical protein